MPLRGDISRWAYRPHAAHRRAAPPAPKPGTPAQTPYERITEAEFNSYAVTSIADGTDEECTTSACPVR